MKNRISKKELRGYGIGEKFLKDVFGYLKAHGNTYDDLISRKLIKGPQERTNPDEVRNCLEFLVHKGYALRKPSPSCFPRKKQPLLRVDGSHVNCIYVFNDQRKPSGILEEISSRIFGDKEKDKT